MTSAQPRLPTILMLLLLACLLQACASSAPSLQQPAFIDQQQIAELQLEIMSLDAGIDPSEARHAASIAIEYPRQLARQYDINDPPLVHNMLVNLGLKERGLCIDWTEDLTLRLRQERFHSLDLHWGIANYDSSFRIEHSSVIISARGQTIHQGIVLDPWRNAGLLFWAKTDQDPSYQWHPQVEILAQKRARKTLEQNRASAR